MKFSIAAILFASLVAGSLSKPAGLILGYQDTLGQYSFGYSAPHQARSEVRSLDGVTRGSYSYVDAAGLVQSADYTADGQNGFRVAATNLPQAPNPVQDTPEVAAARAAHLLAVDEAARAVETPYDDSDSVTIVAKTSEQEEETEKEVSPSDLPAEPIIEAVPEAETESAGSTQTADAATDADNEPKEEAPKEAEVESEQKGRAIEESANPQAPWIAPAAAASLPVPLIPVNFDLPTITAYSGRPANAKAERTLPQATSVQGTITPAGTTLKSAQNPDQLVAVTPQITVKASEPALAAATGESAQYEKARAVFAPVAPFGVIPLSYDPTISSFYRYAPFPYITYNIL